MIETLREWLVDPSVARLDVDSAEFSVAHRRVLQRKVILRSLFEKFYQECRSMDLRFFDACPGIRIEIGSGAGIIRDFFPDVITSDIKQLPFVEIVLTADRLPFADCSIRAIYAINVFHHLPSPTRFLNEALRVLHSGGGLVLIEPFHGPVAAWLFKNLHKTEAYEPQAESWETPNGMGPFSNANQALSYMIFKRDRERFEAEFPQLEIVQDQPHTHLWYILSGGLNFRQLVPNSFATPIRFLEWALSPLDRWIALQHTIVLRKRVSA